MLEGLAKHNGPVGDGSGAVAKSVRRVEAWRSLELDHWASAEAQVAALSDDIAGLFDDVDDGLRAGLVSFDMLEGVPLVGPIAAEVAGKAGSAAGNRIIYETTRRMITAMVADVVSETRVRLQRLVPQSPDDIRSGRRPNNRVFVPHDAGYG